MMPAVYSFRAVQYAQAARGGGGDMSALVAPPYDVLDGAAKGRLLARDAHNIVAIDLPHLPAKEPGPPAAYAGAAETYKRWFREGVLVRASAPAMFVYRQTFESGGRTVRRLGMACTVEVQLFGARPGGGILPHEETFSGPKEDRLALMRATRAQLSPIFGLHPDEKGAARSILAKIAGSQRAEVSAMVDGVLHEVWIVRDAPTIAAYQGALAGEDVFIADGHHRYNTALNYLKELESRGPVAADHPARRCMIVLVSMHDPGLAIWPTHRVLGGMSGYTWDKFLGAARESMQFESVTGGLKAVGAALDSLPSGAEQPNRLGFYDYATGAAAIGRPREPDPLARGFADKPAPWRRLDVALVQHLVVERICQPALNGGKSVKWAFPHTIPEVEAIGRGSQTGAGGGAGFSPQLAVLLRPTPLEAVREISRAGELMPQKSTFFYPKLATGLFVNPLE